MNTQKLTESELSQEFQQRFASTRLRVELTFRELSERSGINLSQISNYANGERFPSAHNVRRLAIALGVSTDYLLALEDEAPTAANS